VGSNVPSAALLTGVVPVLMVLKAPEPVGRYASVQLDSVLLAAVPVMTV
jgi:hypothetical protein